MSKTTPPIPANVLCAAEFFEGTELANGWKVTSKIPKQPNSTGGKFSVTYFVERQEGKARKQAFLKALNFRQIAASPDFSRAVEQHMAAFNFERDTLHLCKEKGLRRIATLLEAGEYRVEGSNIPVCYIIFELARGDARKRMAQLGNFDLAWTLRTLHQIAAALQQLHTHGIAHQDLKPSNVLFFEAFGAKIGDLGCADTEDKPSKSPRGHLSIAGDTAYAPPELFYNEVSLDWKTRRLGCDVYLLGSLVVFFFTGGASMTALWQSKLHPSHTYLKWTQDYRSVLPYVRDAFERALEENVAPSIPAQVLDSVLQMVRYLCDPDPKKRGHPEDLGGYQFNLARVISAFNLLATKVEYGLLKP